MAIDAVIERVRHTDAGLRLELAPRVDSDGQDSIPGRPVLTILGPRQFNPEVGMEIWGGANSCTIPNGPEYARKGAHLREVRNCPRCYLPMNWATITNTQTGEQREVWRCSGDGTERPLE